jgi:parvulin-like peptidyl-prolyl isomerase
MLTSPIFHLPRHFAFALACALALALALSLASGPVHAQARTLSDRGEMLDRVAAVVNDGVVLSSELDEQVAEITERIRSQGMEMPPAAVLRQQVLDRLVLQEIQMQRAQRAGIRINDEALNSALADVAQRNGIPLADLPKALASQGVDYNAYRESVRREMTTQVLRQRDVLQRINVSPREIEQFIAKDKNRPSEADGSRRRCARLAARPGDPYGPRRPRSAAQGRRDQRAPAHAVRLPHSAAERTAR